LLYASLFIVSVFTTVRGVSSPVYIFVSKALCRYLASLAAYPPGPLLLLPLLQFKLLPEMLIAKELLEAKAAQEPEFKVLLLVAHLKSYEHMGKAVMR
jgi:hypothetical protein